GPLGQRRLQRDLASEITELAIVAENLPAGRQEKPSPRPAERRDAGGLAGAVFLQTPAADLRVPRAMLPHGSLILHATPSRRPGSIPRFDAPSAEQTARLPAPRVHLDLPGHPHLCRRQPLRRRGLVAAEPDERRVRREQPPARGFDQTATCQQVLIELR